MREGKGMERQTEKEWGEKTKDSGLEYNNDKSL